jgi:uncharacterized phage-associated protein
MSFKDAKVIQIERYNQVVDKYCKNWRKGPVVSPIYL